MCHFITAALPRTAPHAELAAIAHRHGRQFRALLNPGIAGQLGPHWSYFLTTTSACDCGTVLGSARRKQNQANDTQAQTRRLAKKGWSMAKIERALLQKKDSALGAAQRAQTMDKVEYDQWIAFISEVLSNEATKELGLLLHLYKGALDEDFPLQGREPVAVGSIDADLLGNMREDVLYLFHC